MKRQTWKSWIAKLALLTATLLILAICLEVGARWLTDVTPPIILRDGKIGARFIPDYEDDFFVEEIKQHVRLRFNSDGFRGENRTSGKQPDTLRIAVMGDSMIAGLAVVEQDLMTTRLESILNQQHPTKKWQVMNFGVSGASTAQQIALYREVVSQYEPDIVLSCFFVGNDLSDNSKRFSSNPRIYFDFDEDGENFHQLPYSVSRSKISQWLNRNSRFYVWQKRATQIARRSVRQTTSRASACNWVYSNVESEAATHAWKVTAKTIETLNDEVTKDGGSFAVVVVPEAAQVYDELFQEVQDSAPEDMKPNLDVDNPDRRLEMFCEESGVAFWSMASDFRNASSSWETAEAWLFLNGRGHFNARGHQVAAQSLQRFLSQDDQLRPSLAQRTADRR